LRLGSELIAGVAVGVFIGYWLDRAFGTSPLWLMVFFGLGVAAGLLNVFRTARNIQREQAEKVRRGELDMGRDLPASELYDDD